MSPSRDVKLKVLTIKNNAENPRLRHLFWVLNVNAVSKVAAERQEGQIPSIRATGYVTIAFYFTHSLGIRDRCPEIG